MRTKREISFLNLKLIVKQNKIITDWYQKPTFSGRVLNYLSKHSKNQKIAMVYNLVDSALNLANPEFHNKNLKIVENILKNNLYPSFFINKYIQKRLTHKSKTITSNKNLRIPLPFYEPVNDKIKAYFRKYNLDIVFYNLNKTSHLYDKQKDKPRLGDKSNVVYSIPCNDCQQVYIGETKQYISRRIYQHKYDINKDADLHTSLTKHRTELNHSIAFDKVKILHYEKQTSKRLIAEMLYIIMNDTMNTKSDIQKLNQIYKMLMLHQLP